MTNQKHSTRPKLRILLLGGYGVFGGRLVELLSDLSYVEVLIAGRNLDAAKLFCQGVSGAITCRPYLLDRNNIAAALVREKPDLIVDASGPFQHYGDNPYVVIQAAIAAGINYLDFADGSDFVSGVEQFDEAAKSKDVFALSGMSSFPVLSGAAIAELGKDMTIQKIAGGVAPSPRAGIGLNVIKAVVGYAGGPVRLKREGVPTIATGLAESKRFTIAVPGRVPLRNIRFSLVDVPDLQLLPKSMPQLDDIWIGAGTTPESLHRVLNLLAKLRAWLKLPSMAPLARQFHWVMNHTGFGEHRGGMFIQVSGDQDGKPITRSWHLLAEGDDGPPIPSMPSEVIIRNLLSGRRPKSGARAGNGDLVLQDFATVFDKRAISTGIRDHTAKAPYPQILGTEYSSLPKSLQALHNPGNNSCWAGEAVVKRGNGSASKLIARLFGFPNAGTNVPVTVKFHTRDDGAELWTRRFGDAEFSSLQFAGTGRNTHLMCERFGPFTFAIALEHREGKLHLIQRRWSCLGLPMPKFMLPKGDVWEVEIDGKFQFHVEIAVPIIGRIVQYDGWLKPT